MICRKANKREGVALLWLVAAILVLSLIAAGMMGLFTSGLMEDVETQDWNEAYMAAESGIGAAKAYIVTNGMWYTNSPCIVSGFVGSASYSASITTTNYPMAVIRSTGQSGQSQWMSVWTGTAGVMRALCVYQDIGVSSPCYRIYSDQKRVLFSEQKALPLGSLPQWLRIEESPMTNSFLLVSQNSNRQVWAQTCTNGAWSVCTQLNLTGLVPVNSNRCFDVAYEQNSGRGMVVYGIGTNKPAYRLWYTNFWGTQSLINVGAPANASIRWLRLVARPLTNDMMLLVRYITANNYSMAIRWNGSVWTNLASLETNCASLINFEAMDVAYSTNRATAVYVNGNTANARQVLKYKEFTNSLALWSAEKNISATRIGGEPEWLRIEFNKQGTNAYVACLYAGAHLKGSFWDGTAWDATYDDFTATKVLQTDIRRAFDIAWSSQTNGYMIAYCPQNATNHSYVFQQVGAAAATPTNMAAGTAAGYWSVLRADPNTNEFIYASIDASSDVCVQRWVTNSWRMLGEVETNSSLTHNSIDIGYRR